MLRTLGNTGIEVSAMGLGTVKFGRNERVKYPSSFDLPSDQEIRNLLDCAQQQGINLLDTAPAYGTSEERLGCLLEKRDNWVLCSKVGEDFVNGQSVYNFDGAHVQQSIERSLRRLGTDYLDIVLVHSNGDDLQIIEQSDCLERLSRLKEKGLIRSFGMSTKTVAGGLKAVDHSDLVMVTYNPSTTNEVPVIEKAHAKNKGVLIKKAFNSGHDVDNGSASKGSLDAVNNDPVSRNVKFIFSTPGVTSVIIGTLNPMHLESNAKAIREFC